MSTSRVLLALALVLVPASAQAWCDPAGTLATTDGTLGASEYPGFSSGSGSGFGGYLGAPAELHVDSGAGGALALALDSTGGNCAPGANDTIVLYVDAIPGSGFADTTGFTDNADGGRAAASGMGTDGARADLTFPAGFAPESAVVIRPDFAGVFRLVAGGAHTFVRALTLPAGFATSCVKEVGGLTMDDLGSQAGNPIRFIGTLLNSSNAFRSNEFQGATGPGANIGVASYTIPDTLGAHFESFGPPVALSGPFAYFDFEEYAGTGFSPTPSCGQLSSFGFASTGMSDGALAFGDTRTAGDYARGATSAAQTTGGFWSFDVGGTARRTLGFQPSAADFTPGTLTIRLANQGTTAVSAADVAYVIHVRNDQGLSTIVDFAWSTDGTSFTTVAALQVVTPVALDALGWTANARSTSLSSLAIPPGGFLYLRFSTDDGPGGSGSRDELAIDDLVVRPTFTTCGNGSVDAGETCDLGAMNGGSTCGCQWTCAPAALGVACGGGAGGACDAPDTCDGAGVCVDRVATAGTVCAPAMAGEPCDADDVCDGTTTACAPRFATAGTVCAAADPGLPCDADDVCAGGSLTCSPRVASAGTVCAPAMAGEPCDAADLCDGTTTACAPRFAAAGTVCGAADPGLGCDADDVCDGTSLTCMMAIAPLGTSCRPAAGACDVAEVCTGGSASCPADAAATPGTACGGAPSGVCDAQDVCVGTVGATATCEARFAPSSTVCRASVGDCDLAETCTGTATTCPGDAAAPEGSACGAAPSGACDAQDTCTGTVGATATCEARFAPSSTVCRASVGDCDVSESCTGTTTTCPADAAAAPGTPCGGTPSGPCDAQDVCAGTVGATASCDARVAAAGTECRAAADVCDVAEACTGTSATCPDDALATAGTECRAATDVCDVAELCTGSSVLCPLDGFATAGTECRPMMSTCDVAEVCAGSEPACPADLLDPSCDCTTAADCADSSVCTTDACEIPTGSTVGMCTNDRVAGCCELDTDCSDDDGDLCTAPTCDTGTNTCSELPVVCDDDDPCTTDACAPSDGSCTFEPIVGCGVDGGMPDGGMPDAGEEDAGLVPGDAGVRDTGPRDAAADAAGLDAGTGGVAGGCGCRAGRGSSSAPLVGLALLGLLLSRRR